MLFIELALIRGTSANIVYLSWFTNFVLLASFLGIGVGFLRARAARDRFGLAPGALAALVGFVLVFPVHVGTTVQGQPQLEGLFGTFALPSWITLPLVFVGVAFVMACVAEGVARLFATFSPLEAYRLDILGSLAGIVAFSLLSFLGAGPLVWGLAITAAFLLLLRGSATRGQRVALGSLVLLLAVASLVPGDIWSPYYRVSVLDETEDGRIAVRVNGRPHQTMVPLARLLEDQPIYEAPYRPLVLGDGGPGDVLIVGAGSGNDVAVALSRGASSVEAVEIDPVLNRVGREIHPSRPYADPRVRITIDDGRAFLERTDRTFDLILFALPDSLTLVSGQGSLRLESYLFTREAIESVREHLRPGGAFAMYNYYRPFVFQRYAATLVQVFGHAPCLEWGERGAGPRRQAALTIGVESEALDCPTRWVPAPGAPEAATDDHPFPYVHGRSIPLFYAWTLGLILVASIGVVRVASGGPLRRMRAFVDLCFMGVAFLLLETTNVVRFALWFGTTWFVNSLVFAGILLAVYLAVEVARRRSLPRPAILYVALLVSIVLAWLVPPGALLGLSVVPRFALAVGLAFTPVFVANLIFAQRFKDVGSSTVAFGANLLGAMVGGVLEYGAIVVGYRNLLVLVAALYGLAYVAGREHLRGERPEHERELAGIPG
jgi:SAM-dependent methyltransferase